MSGELLFVTLFCVVPVVLIGLTAYGMIQRIYHFQEVLANGVETEAIVVRKYKSSNHFKFRNRIIFEYRDALGKVHRKNEAVLASEYDRLQAGDTIKVLYSAKRPYVCAFKEAVEQARAAMAREKE